MERFPKVATPEAAARVVAPEKVPPPALFPMATAMLAEELVPVFPMVSWAATGMSAVRAAEALALVGWTVKASLVAAAGEMLKALEVAPVRGAEAAVRV